MKRCSILRNFIHEELVWNYWMRRPKNERGVGDISVEIEKRRRDALSPEVDEFISDSDEISRDVRQASSVPELQAAIARLGCNIDDVVADPDEFQRALKAGSLEVARNQLLMGLEKSTRDSLADFEEVEFARNASGPMRHVYMGAPSLKRSMGI